MRQAACTLGTPQLQSYAGGPVCHEQARTQALGCSCGSARVRGPPTLPDLQSWVSPWPPSRPAAPHCPHPAEAAMPPQAGSQLGWTQGLLCPGTASAAVVTSTALRSAAMAAPVSAGCLRWQRRPQGCIWCRARARSPKTPPPAQPAATMASTAPCSASEPRASPAGAPRQATARQMVPA